MGGLARKIRGMLGVGVTWGAAWGIIGAGVGAVMGVVSPELWTFANPIAAWALGMGVYGMVSGMGFAAVLSLTEGRRTLDQLSVKRVALWGVLGSAAVPLLFGALGLFGVTVTAVDVLQAIAVTGGLGGVFASGSVALARKAALEAGEVPDALGPGD